MGGSINKIKIAIADDHQLFCKALTILIETFQRFEVIIEAPNGKILIERFKNTPILPDILLLDVSMPVLNGPKAAEIVARDFPTVRIVALTMQEEDQTVIKMIRAGCCAYLLKDIHPTELEKALIEINETGYFNSDVSSKRSARLLRNQNNKEAHGLTDKELIFLKYACSDLTYKQIAHLMGVSERTIDGYRESVFAKLEVKSRVGMVLEAIRLGLVDMKEIGSSDVT